MLNIISAKCGLGKSHTMVQTIVDSTHDKHLLVVPSLDITEQMKKFFDDATTTPINLYILNTRTVVGTVFSAVMELITNPPAGKHVIVITHATYHKLTKSLIKDYNVSIDEIPAQWIEKVGVVYDWNHTHDKYFITNTDGTLKLSTEAKEGNATLENSNLYDLLTMVKDKTSNVHVLGSRNVGEASLTEYLAVITPNYFSSNTTLYTADDHVSDIVSILKTQMPVNITTLPNPTNRVHHYNTDQIEFIYFMDDRNNSLNVSRVMQEEYDAGLKLIMDTMSGNKSLILMNNEVKARVTIPDNFITVKNNVHGINKYNRLQRLVVQSATNRSMSEEKCLMEYYKLTEDQIFNSRIANIHQAIMRLAIRRQDFNEKVSEFITVGFVDLQTAYACKSLYFPNATLSKVGDLSFKTIRKSGQGRPLGSFKANKLTDSENNKGKAIRKKAANGYEGYSERDLLIISMNPKTVDLMKTDLWNKLSPTGLYLSK